MTIRLFATILLLVAAALFCAACGAPTPTLPPTSIPTPPPTSIPTPAPTTGPTVDRIGARDAALAYVRTSHGADAPAADLAWVEQHAKPAELVGGEAYQYLAGDWLILVSYPVVMPEQTAYTISMVNFVTGFIWDGRVGAGGQVIEGGQLLLNAFDVALTHARAQYGDEAPPAGLPWVGELMASTGPVNVETWRYTAGDWMATIVYSLVTPADQLLFNITIQNVTIGFMWLGSVSTDGQVTETE